MELKKPTHIFIVENNKYFVRMLDYIFSKSIAYRFLDFKTGEDCLKNLHLNPEIIVLDCRLPAMNGFETMLEIKEQHPSARVIMLMGDCDGRLPAELINAGAEDYVLKNGKEIETLIDKIESMLTMTKKETVAPVIARPGIRKKLYYALLLIALVSAGIYYYQ